jgi:hypothetical protein
VAAFDVPPQGLSRHITTPLQVFGSEHHVQNYSAFFSTKVENGFLKFKSKD